MSKQRIHPITIAVALVIVSGFIISGFSYCRSFQRMYERDVEAVSELTSENIYVNISSLMDRPINVSTTMAHDTFLRDFINKEANEGLRLKNLVTMQQYLASYQEKYQFDSVFFVSQKTKNYYHYSNGLDRVLTPDNPENEWYYDFLESPLDCALNVDNDEARENFVTIFVNCKLYDENKNLLGVVGVGMETPYIQQFLLQNEQNFGVKAYLIDRMGNIQVSAYATEFENMNLFTDTAFREMASAIDMQTVDSNQRWYHSQDKDGYVITRYIPNLNWYLVVEKNTQDFRKNMIRQLHVNLIFMLCVLLGVVVITTKMIRTYNFKLSSLAKLDQLTGIRNRTSYELEILKYAQGIKADQQFGIGVCDLNNLKVINDSYGHQAGDRCLKIFAEKLCETFSHGSVFRIGGDEFAIVFTDMTEEAVWEHWNRLLLELAEAEQIDKRFSIHAAFGCAFWEAEKLNTVEKIFKSADDNMYQNKKETKSVQQENLQS